MAPYALLVLCILYIKIMYMCLYYNWCIIYCYCFHSHVILTLRTIMLLSKGVVHKK